MLEMQDAYRDVGGRTVSGTTVEQFSAQSKNVKTIYLLDAGTGSA